MIETANRSLTEPASAGFLLFAPGFSPGSSRKYLFFSPAGFSRLPMPGFSHRSAYDQFIASPGFAPRPQVPGFARRTTPARSRRGAIYVAVLMTALIVACTGYAALLLARVQNATADGGNSFIEARSIARSAIDIGMLKIRNDAAWRTSLGNGTWVNNQALGDGTYSLSAVDPIDSDVTNGDNHPIVLTGTGSIGGTTYKTSVRLEVGPRVGSCLEVSMTSGGNSTVTSATLTSDQTVCANGSYTATSATVNANVEALSSISGSSYTKSQTNRTIARYMPNSASALAYYTTNGTTINYSDLPQFTSAESLTNTSFETNASGWSASGGAATLTRDTSQHNDGVACLKVKTRASASAVAAQSVPISAFTSGNTFHLNIPIRSTANCSAAAVLTLTSSGSGTQTFSTPTISFLKNIWTNLEGDLTPTWTGTLTAATVSISISVSNDYYMDAVSLMDVTYPGSAYVIDKQLLSPSVNPYGSQQINSQGIYIINCSGHDVMLGRARIVGTLVFVNPGSNSAIQGPVIWEAAVSNFPALLSDTTLAINFDSAVGLDESSLGINLNPASTPYPYVGGVTNSTLTDAYPSKITGLLYSSQGWTFSGAPNISGVVIADQAITVTATSLTLSYLNTYLNDPPSGFDVGTITMKVVPGTWKRSID